MQGHFRLSCGKSNLWQKMFDCVLRMFSRCFELLCMLLDCYVYPPQKPRAGLVPVLAAGALVHATLYTFSSQTGSSKFNRHVGIERSKTQGLCRYARFTLKRLYP
jgi:hypothetical protein